MTIYKGIDRYIDQVQSEKIRTCDEQKKLAEHVFSCFENEDIKVDEDKAGKYLSLVKYFPYDELFTWEQFVGLLWNCVFEKDTGLPRWPRLFCLIGRGAGKDGLIAYDAMYSTSKHHGIRQYNVDICANNEEQAMTPVEDVVIALETPEHTQKLKRHFYWTKERVKSLDTLSTIRGRTNSPKGKDGLRSGKVVFNEIHGYENYANINVFTTGLGKKPHPRRGYFTTQGDVRDGPLDHMVEQSERILNGEEPDDGLLPFICKLDDPKEVHDEKNWEKANPSLPYRPDLMAEVRQEYKEWKEDPAKLPAFMTKRMNIPDGNPEVEVTNWENIEKTKRELPDVTGWDCTVGIDYTKVTDWASVNYHFRRGNDRFDINHSWLCTSSKDLPRIRATWKLWAQRGHITVVDAVEIAPEIIAEHIRLFGQKYNIIKVALDNFRYALLAGALEKIGFSAENKNIKLIRPSDIMTVVPVIDSAFANQYFHWGDNPPLRWAVNNTKLIRSSKRIGSDTGNFYYGKIEAKSRKTDPFMALVASMVVENELEEERVESDDFAVFGS